MRWIEKRNRWLLAGNRPWKTVAKKRKGGRSHREEDSIRPEGRFRGKRRLANKRKIAALLARGKTKQPRNRTDLVGFRRGLSETACSRQCSIGKGIALSCDRFFIFFSFLLFLFSFSFLFFCLQRYTQWLKLVVDELRFRYILQRFRERERERERFTTSSSFVLRRIIHTYFVRNKQIIFISIGASKRKTLAYHVLVTGTQIKRTEWTLFTFTYIPDGISWAVPNVHTR